MKRIHITFPVVICKDVLRRQPQKLLYEASISGGVGTVASKGSVCAGQILGPNGDEFIDIIIEFPSQNKTLHFVKGKLHCQIDEVREKQTFNLDSTGQSTATGDTSDGTTKSAGKLSRLKLAEVRRKTELKTAAAKAISEGRPCRHKEKPAKFKDYDTELDFIRRDGQKHIFVHEDEREHETEAPNPTEFENKLSERTENGSPFDEAKKRGRKRIYISCKSNSTGMKKRKTYDKLIKHLTQATAKEGCEIQSVLCSLKSSIYKDQKRPLLMSEQEPGHKEEACSNCHVLVSEKLKKPFHTNEHETHTNGEAKTEIVSRESLHSSTKSELITKKVRVTSDSQFKSFPRKFPTSLRSSFKPCLLQQDLPNVGQNPHSSDEVLNKYRIINQSTAVLEHADNDTINPDDDLEIVDRLDVETKKSKKRERSYHARKTKQIEEYSSTAEEEGDRLLDKFQVLHASAVELGDQFFIPQTTYVRDGKMNTMLTGPFRLLESGNQSYLEIVPENERYGMPKVLYGDLHLPHTTVWGLEGTGTKVFRHILGTAAFSATLDHDYIKGSQEKFDVPKIPKTFLKPIRMAQHISARVEKVEEAEGKSLVTISGCNNKAKSDAGNLLFTPRLNAEGIPVADSLEDVMTDRIRRVKLLLEERENYLQALEAKPTAPEIIGVSDLQVSGEVILKAWGEVKSNRHGIRRNWVRGRPRKHLPLSSLIQEGVMKMDHECAAINEKNIIVTLQDVGSNAVVVNMQHDVSLTSGTGDGKNHGDESPFVDNITNQERNYVNQGIIGANFRPGEVIEIDDVKGTLCTDLEEPNIDIGDVIVPRKNDLESSPLLQTKTLKMCNYCLRLFPESVLLYRHVKNDHSTFFKDAGYQQYLHDLRLEKLFICPFCPGRCSLSNEYRFRTHLAQMHKIQMKEQDDGRCPFVSSSLECEICHSWSELEVHAIRVHNSQLLSCPQCTDAFLLDNTLSQHLRQVHGVGQKLEQSTEEKVQKTNIEHYMFSGTSQMKMNLHKRPRRNSTSSNLQHHKERLRVQSCTYCRKFFKTAGSLARHIEVKHSTIEEGRRRKVMEESQVQGTLSLDQFPSAWDVEEQHCVHVGPVPVHCVFCAAECSSVTSMYTHIDECHLLTVTHTCPVCQDPFQSENALAQHAISIHGFEYGGNLGLAPSHNLDEVSDSKRTDSSVQNLQCPYCADVFPRTSLVAHIVEDHREHFPHSCLRCEQTFLTNEMLQCHAQLAHGQDIAMKALASSSETLPKDIMVTSKQNFSPIVNHQDVLSILDSQSAVGMKPALLGTLPAMTENIIWCVDHQGLQTVVRGDGDATEQQLAACPRDFCEFDSHFNNLIAESTCGVQCVEIVTEDRIAVATKIITADVESEPVRGMELSITNNPAEVSVAPQH